MACRVKDVGVQRVELAGWRRANSALRQPTLIDETKMKKIEFVRQLREAADDLSPLTRSMRIGSLTWDGTAYVKSEKSESPVPHALAWQAMLEAIAALIEAQDSPINEKQTIYLEKLLFGGMGSFHDLYFDVKLLGKIAETVNGRLKKRMGTLYTSFIASP